MIAKFQLDPNAPAAAIRLRADPVASVPAASTDATLVGRFALTPLISLESIGGASPIGDEAVIAGNIEPVLGVDESDDRLFTVQIEWPWLLASGLLPIGVDSVAQAKREPQGWLENWLNQQAINSPLDVVFGVDGYGEVVSNSPFWETWAGQTLGTLDLSGDFSTGFTLTGLSFHVDRLSVSAGNDYDLVASDKFVAPGATLVIDANALGPDDGIAFDGSAETDGQFSFVGGAGDDSFIGGTGDDRMVGLGGADTLAGGGGRDIFAYTSTGESSGQAYDTLADFDPLHDRIDLPGSVSSFGATIAAGTLSTATFNGDLTALLGGLAPSQAVWLSPNAGDFAGELFLVVDGNGQAGYQAGQDYVFAVAGSPLADLTGQGGIFI